MKYCNKCDETKDDDQYYSKGNKLQSMCKQCFNRYCMDRWTSIKLDVVKQFNDVCLDCGQSYPHPVYEFHHLDPAKKEYSWTKMRLMSPARRQAELDKCIMLCANCHRIRHLSNPLSG